MSLLYQWLLFDADDTLFDYTLAETGALQATLEQFDRPFNPHTLERYQDLNHQLWLQLERGEISSQRLRTKRFELLFDDLGWGNPPPNISDAYIEQLGSQVILRPGAVETLDALKPYYRFAIITNGLTQVQRRRLAASLIREHISELFISEEIGHAKPSREIFDHALAKMGNPPPAQVLIIGDSLSSDMAGGIASGLRTCWYNPKGLERPPELALTNEIQDLRDLIPWLTPTHSTR